MSKATAVLPFISVVVPSYNQASFIKRAIDSVLAQQYSACECLVIDAGSTDETHSILAGYEKQVTVVQEPGLKQSEVLNKGLALSRGDIISFLNADDAYAENTFSVVQNISSRNKMWRRFTVIFMSSMKLVKDS